MTPASAARRKISLTKGKLGKEKRQGLTQFLTCGERLDHIRQSVKEKFHLTRHLIISVSGALVLDRIWVQLLVSFLGLQTLFPKVQFVLECRCSLLPLPMRLWQHRLGSDTD